MKILHLGDLHIGKKVNEFSMIEDQKYILDQILAIIDKQQIDVVLLCGDIYDKSIPPIEAVEVLDSFLFELYKRNLHVCMISGNHDSSDRLSFGYKIFESSNIHIASKFKGEVDVVTITKDEESVNIFMLPFVKPAIVNHLLDVESKSYDESVRYIIDQTAMDTNKINILMAHQFVTANNKGPDISDSEVQSLGGLDNVDASIFKGFDYVALGHIHKPQAMGSKYIRYSGSILKYSFSEANIAKSACIIETGKKEDEIILDFIPLEPLHDMQELRCTIDDILSKKTLHTHPSENYVHVILTDEDEIIDAIGKVRSVYPKVMQITFDNKRTRERLASEDIRKDAKLHKANDELFNDFFMWQNNIELSESQREVVADALAEVEDK